ncbi:MAG: hypothetical protein H0V67_01480 [Geodermatophilaceae bacterium]|nr:hypothetical protein [Geodermatophilaceae bacterium]
MGTAPYISTVVSICLLALGAIYMIMGHLGRRIDDVNKRFDSRFDDMNRHFDGRFDAVDSRFDDVNKHFDSRLDSINGRLDDLRTDMDARFTGFRAEVGARFSGVENRLGRLETQGDTIIGAVTDLGERATRLEARTNS